jgi:hypothetical protein
MVETAQCFVTKFGSHHMTKEDAERAELKEDRENFAKFLADQGIDKSGWTYWNDVGIVVYNNRDKIVEAIQKYNFINMELTND